MVTGDAVDDGAGNDTVDTAADVAEVVVTDDVTIVELIAAVVGRGVTVGDAPQPLTATAITNRVTPGRGLIRVLHHQCHPGSTARQRHTAATPSVWLPGVPARDVPAGSRCPTMGPAGRW